MAAEPDTLAQPKRQPALDFGVSTLQNGRMVMYYPITFGRALRVARTLLALSSAELAAALDVSERTVRAWELDERLAPPFTRMAVARGLARMGLRSRFPEGKGWLPQFFLAGGIDLGS